MHNEQYELPNIQYVNIELRRNARIIFILADVLITPFLWLCATAKFTEILNTEDKRNIMVGELMKAILIHLIKNAINEQNLTHISTKQYYFTCEIKLRGRNIYIISIILLLSQKIQLCKKSYSSGYEHKEKKSFAYTTKEILLFF